MLLMGYAKIGEDLYDYAKTIMCNLFYAYIDAHNQIIGYEYWVDGLQAISILKFACANITFADKSNIIDHFIK